MISDLAYSALLKEVELTPKPGLVDKNNNGSHKDMCVETFYASAKAIKPFIDKFLQLKEFSELRRVGKECEDAMFKATKGVNTHKGMIFSLAVICSSIGKTDSFESLQRDIKILCKDLVKHDLKNIKQVKTHGEEFYVKTKCAGIRAEAQSGYATIFSKSLPFYEKNFLKYGEDIAMKLTLVYLMSFVDDSTLFARGGEKGLNFVKNKAKKILYVDNLEKNLKELDKKMIEKNLSAGGSADLLALTWFLFNFKYL